MGFRIELTKAALRDLKALQKRDLIRIDAHILSLAETPLPRGVKKLAGEEDLFRIRVGDYRIIYTIQEKESVILIIRIRHRRDAYR